MNQRQWSPSALLLAFTVLWWTTRGVGYEPLGGSKVMYAVKKIEGDLITQIGSEMYLKLRNLSGDMAESQYAGACVVVPTVLGMVGVASTHRTITSIPRDTVEPILKDTSELRIVPNHVIKPQGGLNRDVMWTRCM